jgi:CRP-like cAMP-binding protein
MKTRPLIAKLELFAPLSDEEKAAIEESAGDIIEYAPKQTVIAQGDKPDHVHLLLEGWAGRYKILPDGGRQIMALLIPGDLCDVQVTLLDRMDHSIAALSACRILSLPLGSLSRLMEKHPALHRALWWSTLVDEAILREWLVNIGRRSAEMRVGHFICEMLLRSKAVGLTKGDVFDLLLTQEELADTMGLTPEHMNRSLQKLRSQGLIESHGKRIVIADFDRLMAFSEFDPIYLHQEAESDGARQTEDHPRHFPLHA